MKNLIIIYTKRCLKFTEDKDPGYVVEVSQKGYLLYDRLVRPAMVGISKKPDNKPLEKNKEN